MDGPNIPINVELANAIGLNETILLQQIHYWCCNYAQNGKVKNNHYHDGQYWVYNSIDQWTEQLPWAGESTTERAVRKLREKGLIIVGYYSHGNRNRTTWYRINYDKLAEITASFTTSSMTGYMPGTPSKMSSRSRQYDVNDTVNLTGTNNIEYSKNTEVNGDLPLTENPTTVKPLSVENDNCFDSAGIDLGAFISWYSFEYARRFGKNHPPLSADQRFHVKSYLTNFLDDPEYCEIDAEGLQQMAMDFFNSVQSNDWHIFHFVDPEILKYRFYNIYRQGYEY